MYSSILFEQKAGIVVITLNRPRVLNALSRALKGELSDALGRVAKDPDIRAVVLIGAGKAFSAGQDLNEAKDMNGADAEEWVREFERLYDLSRAFSSFYDRQRGVRVVNAETEDLRNSRLRLCDLTARTLELGLGLLGIRVLEEM